MVGMMHDDLANSAKVDPLQKIMTKATEPQEAVAPARGASPISPLGWSIKFRLLVAALASALLWLAVAWALGWLS